MPFESSKANRLAFEQSPYLLQHAHNPVDWYSWGEEAFAKARAEDRPIFLSIGYSTCHWCHVMERESFSDPKMAEILNRHFVAIKVDREERPDVDRAYMTAVQLMAEQGGWPLNVFLTPELKPFFGGTYFPPEPRWGRPGFADLLLKVSRLWKEKREELTSSGERLEAAVREYAAARGEAAAPDSAALAGGFESYRATFDPVHGGFGGAPKFPMPVDHRFLLRYYARTKEREALEMSAYTLRQMARGGVFDQLGGGFHRYSTDERWHVPHFEKMLYDNAQLASCYLEAYQATGDAEFAETARATLEYVLRDLTHAEGGFCSAEDADSPTEGAFYIWEKKDILKIAGAEAGGAFCRRYGVESGGNAAADPSGEFQGKNILYQACGVEEVAKQIGKPSDQTRRLLDDARRRLFEARGRRPRPLLDDKILASWNGLMISAMALGSVALEEPRYSAAGAKAAGFIRKNLYDSAARRLYRSWRAGTRKIPGIADDYLFLAQGLLDLYEASFERERLRWAQELMEAALELFYDAERGGFYLTAANPGEKSLPRFLEDMDNVEPSASSIAVMNLLRLWRATGNPRWREAADKTLTRFGETLRRRPRAMPQMLAALDFYSAPPLQIVLAGSAASPEFEALAREARRRFLPRKSLDFVDDDASAGVLASAVPSAGPFRTLEGRAAAYVCVNFTCRLPVSDPKALGRMLDELAAEKL